MGQTPALLLAFVIQIAAFLLPVVDGGAAANLASAVLYGGTFVGIVSLSLSIVGRNAPANPAKAMARLTVGYGVAQIIAPAMTGYMVDSSGSYAGPLGVAAIVMAAGALLLLKMIARENAGRRLQEQR
jgi:MFS family permease